MYQTRSCRHFVIDVTDFTHVQFRYGLWLLFHGNHLFSRSGNLDTSTFGQRLRRHREQRNMGLNELSKVIGVSPGYLSNLETGKTDKVSLPLLEKLSQILYRQGCPLCDGVDQSSDRRSELQDIDGRLLQRINALFTHLHHLAESSPNTVSVQLDLLEHGWRWLPTEDLTGARLNSAKEH